MIFMAEYIINLIWKIMYQIAALYQFTNIDDPIGFKNILQEKCDEFQLIGTLLIAHEGLNGTIAGKNNAIQSIMEFLIQDKRFNNINVKYSRAKEKPFNKLKILIKKEIVTLGVPGINPLEDLGEYVKAEHWNELINDPEMLVLDTRNEYEVTIGTFKGAINPHTQTFRDFPDFVDKNLDASIHKKVAMFCTGGIRCEKATSFLKKLGFDNVYHLQGGILQYLEDIKVEKSLWVGECFVFDKRIAVTHGVKQSNNVFCKQCRYPLTKENDSCSDDMCCPQCGV